MFKKGRPPIEVSPSPLSLQQRNLHIKTTLIPAPTGNYQTANKKYVDDTAAAKVSDTAYAASWDAVTTIAPSKNAVYDKVSSHEADPDAHLPALLQGFMFTAPNLYVDDTAIGFRYIWYPTGFHLEYENTTGKTFWVAN